MWGPCHAQGAAESDASVHSWVRSPAGPAYPEGQETGYKRSRPESGRRSRKDTSVRRREPGKPASVGIRLWAALSRISAHADLVISPGNVDGGPTKAGRTSSRGKVALTPEPPPENLGRECVVFGSWTGGEHVRSIHAPEPPLCICSRAGR
jgi:hypothetical protein